MNPHREDLLPSVTGERKEILSTTNSGPNPVNVIGAAIRLNSSQGILKGNIIRVIMGDTGSVDYNPYNNQHNPSFHFMFRFLFHLILHYRVY